MDMFDKMNFRTMPSEVGFFDYANDIMAKKPKAKPKDVEEPSDQVEISSNKPPKYEFTEGNYVEALTDSGQVLDKLTKQIAGAKESVMIEIYRLGHDKIVDLLVDQAKKGVHVQLLMDPTPGYDSADAAKQTAMKEKLSAAGVEILKYPINGPAGKIDHVKLCIVDGKSLLVGGMNFDQHSPENTDQGMLMRGPVVGDALDIFKNDIEQAGGLIADYKTPGAQPDANAKVRMLATEVDRKDIDTALQENIKKAKKSIFLEAFALADKGTIANLIAAKERGVDVKVLLDPNKPIFFTNLKAAKELREAGVEVRWLKVDAFKKEKLHAKLAVFDEETTMNGSCNFTKAGLQINHEVDAEVISKEVGTAFTKMFEDHWNKRASEAPPSMPDFYEKIGEEPVKEQLGKELFRYFTANFHPDVKRNFTGNAKESVLAAIEKFDKTTTAAPVEGLGKSGQEDKIDLEKEFKSIGDLASFFGDVENFKMDPPAGSDAMVYDRRCAISNERAEEVYNSIPRYMEDMVNAIENKEIKEFVKLALEKAPSGFSKAASSATGKYHPADEVNPADVEYNSDKPKDAYKGGGLVLHSRRVQKMADKLADHYKITGKDKDELLAAMALHDVMKGVTMDEMKASIKEKREPQWMDTTTPNHGDVAAEWIKSLDKSKGKKLTENIRHYCSVHMGVWNEPKPTPATNIMEFLSSMSDYSVSQRNMYLDV